MKRSKPSPLQSNLKVRIPKDYPWRVLSAVVDDLSDCLKYEDMKLIRNIIRKRDFEAYRELSSTWDIQSIDPSGTFAGSIFAKYQVTHLMKKFRFQGDTKARRFAAKEKFLAAEQTCKSMNSVGLHKLARLDNEAELSAFTYALGFIRAVLGSCLPDESELTFWSRHGPGSNLDTKFRNTSTYFKYAEWPYSCTSLASRHARNLVLNDERWYGALEDSYRERNHIPKHEIIDQGVFLSSIFNIVPGNRITFVPKNSQIDRSIAIEPSMNLYLQLGVDGYIRRRLKRRGIDLDDQTVNQELARQGSRDWRLRNSYVTIDLASASDSVSIELCRLMLPPQWFTYLMDLRSPSGELDGETISFEKISSMGNGYTFALESLIFAAFCYGCVRTLCKEKALTSFSVYGDDIVIRKEFSALLVTMLNHAGFSINSDKSFFEGAFRESCGADWFNGTPVRPIFLTTMPSTVMELWCDSNRLRRILSLRVLEDDPKSCTLIDSWIPPDFRKITGPFSDEDFDSYRHDPIPASRDRLGRWKFKRLIVSAKHLKGEQFLFRKLMHSLRPSYEPPSRWSKTQFGGKAVTNTGGSVFTVTRSNSVTVSVTSDYTYEWCSLYSEPYSTFKFR